MAIGSGHYPKSRLNIMDIELSTVLEIYRGIVTNRYSNPIVLKFNLTTIKYTYSITVGLSYNPNTITMSKIRYTNITECLDYVRYKKIYKLLYR